MNTNYNPAEQCPPDDLIETLTITATLKNQRARPRREFSLLWHVSIPEMAYEGYTQDLDIELERLGKEVTQSNIEILQAEIADGLRCKCHALLTTEQGRLTRCCDSCMKFADILEPNNELA